MRNRDIPELLDQLVEELPLLMRREGFSQNTCILQTRVALLVLQRRGIPARPLPTSIAAMNAEYQRWITRAGDMTAEQEAQAAREVIERGGWAVTIGLPHPDSGQTNGWDGHLVLGVKNRWLVDLTLDQASRPEKGIALRPGFIDAADFLTGVASSTTVGFDDTDAVVTYMNSDDRAYLRAPDWTMVRPDSRLVRHAAEAVERELAA